MTASLCSFPTSTTILLPAYSSMPPQTFLHLLCTHLLTHLLINLNPILFNPILFIRLTLTYFIPRTSNLHYSPRRSPSNPTHRYYQPLPSRSCSFAAPPIFPSLYALLTLDVSRPPFTYTTTASIDTLHFPFLLSKPATIHSNILLLILPILDLSSIPPPSRIVHIFVAGFSPNNSLYVRSSNGMIITTNYSLPTYRVSADYDLLTTGCGKCTRDLFLHSPTFSFM